VKLASITQAFTVARADASNVVPLLVASRNETLRMLLKKFFSQQILNH
jgi:hypothetical protein